MLSPVKRELRRLAELEAKLERRQARQNFAAWAALALSAEGLSPARHHLLLCDHLEMVNDGRIDRLMVLMPPGSAKSYFVSRLFPAYWFMHHPGTAMIAASNTSDLASTFGRRVRNLVQREHAMLGFTIEQDAKAAAKWETSNGGEYYAAGINGGVGTTITGRRCDCAIIDDPTRGALESHNEAIQDKIWDWYRTELYTRLKPNARIVVVMTRWDVRDLGGRLLDEMAVGGDRWTVLKLPAISEDAALSTEDVPIDDDPLGRLPGEPLWPEWEDLAALERKRITLGENGWFALYQQRPMSPTGLLFETDKIGTLEAQPTKFRSIVRAWDTAATEQIGSNDPDYTVGLLLARTYDDRYVVLDIKRKRCMPREVEELIVATAEEDTKKIQIRLPEDPGSAGKLFASYMVTKLAGHKVLLDKETGDKETRANGIISQVSAGNLSIVQRQWNRMFLNELREFPNGRHDDMVDALSGAFNVIGIKMPPMQISTEAVVATGARHPMLGR
jgi:predicted phage terminase large subunit-like protein